jgi:hypothetical protein
MADTGHPVSLPEHLHSTNALDKGNGAWGGKCTATTQDLPPVLKLCPYLQPKALNYAESWNHQAWS